MFDMKVATRSNTFKHDCYWNLFVQIPEYEKL